MCNIIELCTVNIKLKNNKSVYSRITRGLLNNLLCRFCSSKLMIT